MTRKRGRRPLPSTERKQRVVQARIDEELSETLQREAKRKRLTVSQLIRNVLEDTFDLVDHVVADAVQLGQSVKRDAKRIAESAQGQPRRPVAADARTRERPRRAPAADAVYAWQAVVLARDTLCGRCGRSLAVGEEALVGLTDDPTAIRVWRCRACGSRR